MENIINIWKINDGIVEYWNTGMMENGATDGGVSLVALAMSPYLLKQ